MGSSSPVIVAAGLLVLVLVLVQIGADFPITDTINNLKSSLEQFSSLI